uniref:Uncharacterized protein n=1 Tax=Aegilops tauschii TaxID=37682 RepID=R7W703_AEGTA
MEGVASIALLPSGAISGHFIRLPDSACYGLQGTLNTGKMSISGINLDEDDEPSGDS